MILITNNTNVNITEPNEIGIKTIIIKCNITKCN